MKNPSTTPIRSHDTNLVRFEPFNELCEEFKGFTSEIEKLAYQFFEGRGRENGHELEDWFKAESELLEPLECKITEKDGAIRLQADVPGFTLNDLSLAVEPGAIIIHGKRTTSSKRKDAKAIVSEHSHRQLFKRIELPDPVLPGKVTATLKNGVLEIHAPKSLPAKTIPIRAA